ncbi:MAG: hypothetical protein ACXV98_03495 [Ilumatobacteraceae bacterium]
MPRRSSCSAALAVAIVLCVVTGLPARPASAAVLPAPPRQVDTWAWCGVNPDAPTAATAVRAMAQAGGIDATFGPCDVPSPDYTPVTPADRYVNPDVYMRLVLLNATVGMKTVVYDSNLWSHDPNVRLTAINFWRPVLANIAAWDLGDEYSPDPSQWNVLKDRWNILYTEVEPRTGVPPFANFLPTTLSKALTDLPGVGRLLSFAKYDGDLGASLVQQFHSQAKLMCAVNAFTSGPAGSATPTSIRTGMDALKAAGCDQILVFGGSQVAETVTPFQFSNLSVVDPIGVPTSLAPAIQEGSGHSPFIPIGPLRLLETRSGPGLGTADSGFNGIGIRPADSVLALGIAGRASVPEWVRTVVLNVTVTGALGSGYLTVYPCDEARPTSSNLNYDVGVTRAVAVTARVGANGAVCVYTQTPTDVIVDLTGFYASGASFSGIQPARLLDTRVGPEFTTVDAQSVGIGRRPGGTTTAIKVAGRGGVPTDAIAVAVNVTAIAPSATGFAVVYPCGTDVPLASTIDFTAGAIVPNSAIVKIGAGGAICVFSNVDTDLVLDVNGYEDATAVVQLFEPMRVLETRPGVTTADHLFESGGLRPSDTVLQLQIGNRLGIPTAIRAAVLNITVTEATGAGFLTVYPCGTSRPLASTLNYEKGATVANLAVATTSSDGKVCIYTQTATQLVVDLSGYHT